MIIYTVKEGDTLSDIARKYDTTVSRIAQDNRIDPSLSLVVGQSLVILIPTEVYTVKEGDTVISIAKAFNITTSEIWQNNPVLQGKNALFPGQTIVISYPDATFGEKEIGGYAYTYVEDDLLRKTLPYLTYLSVFPYGLTDTGEIISPAGDERLINTAKEYNVRPLLSLTSLTPDGVFSSELVNSVLSNPTLRDTVIDNTVNTVFEKGFGGVDMDFEFIDPSLREAYAQFVELLKGRLGESYTVITDLAPKTYRDQPGLLYEAHDYSSLGNASDRVFLMTYEWGYMYGPPLAISPVENVRSVVEYATSEITPDKILMGLPSYGYDWTLPYVKGESRAETLSSDEALSLARREGAVIEFDTESMAPYFFYTKDEREHVVWFQDARSADALGSLAGEYGLAGVSIWNLMRWFPQLWSVLISLFDVIKLY